MMPFIRTPNSPVYKSILYNVRTGQYGISWNYYPARMRSRGKVRCRRHEIAGYNLQIYVSLRDVITTYS